MTSFNIHSNCFFRLLSINRDEIVSKSQAEVVSKLKSYEVGSTVTLKISRWVEPEANELHAEVIDITIPLQKNEKLGLELRNPNANEYTGLFIEKILQNSAAQMVSKVMHFLKTIKIALGVEHNQFKIENIVSNEIAYF